MQSPIRIALQASCRVSSVLEQADCTFTLGPRRFNRYDTRIGTKSDSNSYSAISEQLGCAPERILFISDANAELVAARGAGLQVLFSERPGNPQVADEGFERINDFSTLQLFP